MKAKKICAICGERFEGFGNNPAPFKGDRCCDRCNSLVVIPARLLHIYAKRKEEK